MLSDLIKMDFEEKSLVEFAENDLKELFDSDYYVEALKAASDLDFSSLFDNGSFTNGPTVVLNDRLIAEASLGLVPQIDTLGLGQQSQHFKSTSKQSLPIKSEHSYSLSGEPPRLIEDDDMSDLESECFPAIPITVAEGSRTSFRSLSLNSEALSELSQSTPVDDHMPDLIRHASTETLSCCGDCCHPDEDVALGHPMSFNFDNISAESKIIKDKDYLNLNYFTGESISIRTSSTNFSENSSCSFTSTKNNLIDIKENLSAILSTRPHNQHSTSNSILGTGTTESSDSVVGQILTTAITKSVEEKSLIQQSTGSLRQTSLTSRTSPRSFTYPPTPPSCSSSDSEGPDDQSPLYETLSQHLCSPRKITGLRSSSRTPINTPLISCQPRGATGIIHLTEEEKRTLISEGYPIPSRLPLTKSEEKSLKKIRRKIKNKISAQESRRKKKEYMDTLEQKVDFLVQDNNECRKKVDSLQTKNCYLLQELQRLQNLVSKDEKNRSRSTLKAMIPSC